MRTARLAAAWPAAAVLALLCLVALLGCSLAAEKQVVAPYWRRGRSSWYGNQASDFVTPFVPHRIGGRDAFGILPW